MGLPVEVNNLMMGSLGGYTVGRSLRLRSSASAYLNRTPSSTGNRQKFTWSGWVKRGLLTTGTYYQLFGAGGAGSNEGLFFDTSAGGLYLTVDGPTTAIVTSAVFRDPSAWYHIVVAVDTTQATAANRMIIYINGVQQTSYSGSYCAQNTNFTYINVGSTQHRMGAHTNSGYYFDGYMAEVNFIDGQQLTPSSFGAYDTNGVWQPKKYTGTYGTNGFYLPFNWSTSTSYAGSFNGSTQYLTVPTNTAFDFGSGDFTIEAWVLTDTTSNRNIVSREWGGNGSGYTGYVFSNTMLVASTSGSAWDVQFTWSAPSANQWHHYAAVRNGNVFSVYIDGIRVGTQTVAGSLVNGFGSAFTIGYRNGQSLPSGSMSNLRVVKGTAVYTSNFTPPTSALTAISGTSLLTLQSSTVIDNSTNAFTITNVGSVAMAASSPFGASVLADASGNNNGWSGNNINYSAYGTTYDSMIDSPTNAAGTSTGIGNYAVLNPLDKGSALTMRNANLGLETTSTSWYTCGSTIGINSAVGKIYAECVWTGYSNLGTLQFGVRVAGLSNNSGTVDPGASANGFTVLWNYTSYKSYTNAVVTNEITTSVVGGDVFQIAFDASSGNLWLGRNNSWLGGGNPSTGTTPTYTGLTNSAGYQIVSALTTNAGGSPASDVNFGQRPFSYTPPSGYKALNTYNLPAPSIANGAQYMAATTWTGTDTGTGRSISGLLFAPDLWWTKTRSASGAYSHQIFDSVRGAGSAKALASDATGAEGYGNGATYGYLSSFDSSGVSFTRGSAGSGANPDGYAYYDESGAAYVGWSWKGGGTAVTNNSGTISSQVSANTTSGFSIVTWTGTGAAAATVGHGLGVAPQFIITKMRSSAIASWNCWHTGINTNQVIYLNSTSAAATPGTGINWNPTSTTFRVDPDGGYGSNASGVTYVAYCFSAVSGYSAFGKITGNGSADGPFIYTGFRPRWVLIKSSDSVNNWVLWDTSRNTYNAVNNELYPNLSNAEGAAGSSYVMDILSNGFKLRNIGVTGTWIYAAFSENPFNISRAR